MKGIIRIYDGFKGYLKDNAEKISYLQLTGKLEQFLVSEFIYYVYRKTKGKVFALSNLGKKGERKYDICLIKGNVKDRKEYIIGIIEAKFINNYHRYFVGNKANDNINESLKSLKNQIVPFNGNKHGDYDVRLISKNNHVYGLVFASFVSDIKNDDKKEEYYAEIKEKSFAFKYHDFENVHLDKVYEDVKVRLVNKDFFVSLKVGLWTLNEFGKDREDYKKQKKQ